MAGGYITYKLNINLNSNIMNLIEVTEFFFFFFGIAEICLLQVRVGRDLRSHVA